MCLLLRYKYGLFASFQEEELLRVRVGLAVVDSEVEDPLLLSLLSFL